MTKRNRFSSYHILLITLLSVIQFSVILDFMVMAPLGAQLMRVLDINASQFGIVVSSYAFSAGISGILTAGFSDKFDRKKLLLFFYGGFILATLFCAIAPNYPMLIAARVITGFFGGVMSSITYAIVTDIFNYEVRGRVMGFIQMSFSASRVLGIPVGLYFADLYDWHFPFFIIVGIGLITITLISYKVKPIDDHLQELTDKKALHRVLDVFKNKKYLLAFATTFFLSTGGFLLMPFSSPFVVNNLGIDESHLALIFGVSGIGTIFTGPLFGVLSDRIGKYEIFTFGSVASILLMIYYTQLQQSSMVEVMIIYSVLMVFISSRIIGSSALISEIPQPRNRGAFMNINSSVQQFSGGVATFLGGLILIEKPTGGFSNFSTLGYIASIAMIICLIFMFFINKKVKAKSVKNGFE